MKKLMCCVLLILPCWVVAEPTVPQTKATIKVDGIMDEAAWQDALVIDLIYENYPAENTPATVKTEAYLLDLGDRLLIGFRAEDPNPENIRAYLRDRDSAYDDDYVGLIVDTYNDQRRALEFFVNPLGVQMDLIRSGGDADDSWNAIWDSAGQITDFGFTVEMAIPYNEIQMPDTAGKKTWGIYVQRTHPRDVRRWYRNVKVDRNNDCFLCQTQKISGFSNVERGLDLEITPTINGLSTRSRELSSLNYGQSESDVEAGIDINWGINANLTLNATVNPDFSQVESDSAQLNVNQNFALFFPERRAFFLENADYFNSNMNLVYTRNIADPDYGLRMVGKNGSNAYGFFYANDTRTNLLIPGVFGSSFASLSQESNSLAGRFRRDIGANASTVGATITNRSGDGYSNRLISADLNYYLTSSDSIQVQLANSETEYPDEVATEYEQPTGSFTGQSYLLQYQHRSRNWQLNAFQLDKGDGFRADSGFISQVGTRKAGAGGGYTWIGDSDKWWNQINVYSDWDITHDQSGRLLEKELEASFKLEGPFQSSTRFAIGIRDRFWNEQLYQESYRLLESEFKPISGLTLGGFIDKSYNVDIANDRLVDSLRHGIRINANLGAHLTANLRHNFSKLYRDAGNILIANQTDFRLSYQFNIRQRLRLSLIHTNINRDLSLYNEPENFKAHSRNLAMKLVYSYKVNPRTVLFVGYSDAAKEDDLISNLTRTQQNLFIKFSYAWKQ